MLADYSALQVLKKKHGAHHMGFCAARSQASTCVLWGPERTNWSWLPIPGRGEVSFSLVSPGCQGLPAS
jgi:hypothetical protein